MVRVFICAGRDAGAAPGKGIPGECQVGRAVLPCLDRPVRASAGHRRAARVHTPGGPDTGRRRLTLGLTRRGYDRTGPRGDLANRFEGGNRLEGGQDPAETESAASLKAPGHQLTGRLRVLVITDLTGAAVRIGRVPADGTAHRHRWGLGEAAAAARHGPVKDRSTRVVHRVRTHFLVKGPSGRGKRQTDPLFARRDF
ncbi:hypothetical protein GCM10022252_08740 [Streptosporangium oxazolinicum]|uniref:Uncharacterized protein n=1 Tax=Streptosporangium oxazolinicum TaxID=909287 RepID=A0ABP8AEC4_9ACTN